MRSDVSLGGTEVLAHASPYMDQRSVLHAVNGHLQTSGRSLIPNGSLAKTHTQRMPMDSDHDTDMSESESLRHRAPSHDSQSSGAQREAAQYAASGQKRGTPANGQATLQQAPQPRRNSGRKKSDSFTSTSTAHETGHSRKYLQLTANLLDLVQIEVINSALKAGDRSNREMVHFLIRVKVHKPKDTRAESFQSGKLAAWLIEKAWIDVQSLDLAVKTKNPKGLTKKLPPLPDRNLFRDHAPARVDQRKVSSSEFWRFCRGTNHHFRPNCNAICKV